MPIRAASRDRPKPPKPVIADDWEHCITVDCDGYARTQKGVRQRCRGCEEQADRIAALGRRLRKASDPAIDYVREHRVGIVY